MNLRNALLTATIIAAPFALSQAAHAQPVTGPYVSLEGGTSILVPVNFNESLISSNTGEDTSGKALYKNSYAGLGAVGYGFGDGFRVELSGDYLRNYASKIDTNALGQISNLGGHNTYGPMLSILYDANVGLPIFPYVGAGAGYQWVKLDSYNKAEGVNFSGTKGSFAFNVIAGLSYPIAMVPGLSLTLEYRFMMLTSSLNYGESITGGFPPGSPTGGTVKLGQTSSHTFLAGVRYQLFQPPAPPPAPAPAPVAAPAPAPAKTYLVFFDWDKAVLTPRATQIIAEAASDSKTTSVTTIAVNGYTDTSGTPNYNLGLSVRRAKAVEAQLVADGVPESEIETHGYGETHLLVPTGPGVREPQNRRVEIIFQ
jgi:outer membrane protein OmpA-like peptidoglycan-associated protein/outer membrane protein W